MAVIRRDYIEDMAALENEPDSELLAPVMAVFEKLQQDRSKLQPISPSSS
jgi:hypothetical protein